MHLSQKQWREHAGVLCVILDYCGKHCFMNQLTGRVFNNSPETGLSNPKTYMWRRQFVIACMFRIPISGGLILKPAAQKFLLTSISLYSVCIAIAICERSAISNNIMFLLRL